MRCFDALRRGMESYIRKCMYGVSRSYTHLMHNTKKTTLHPIFYSSSQHVPPPSIPTATEFVPAPTLPRECSTASLRPTAMVVDGIQVSLAATVPTSIPIQYDCVKLRWRLQSLPTATALGALRDDETSRVSMAVSHVNGAVIKALNESWTMM